MIRIAVADLNEIYCQGLKTMLEQTGEFNVKILNPFPFKSSLEIKPQFDILMIDEDLFLANRKAIKDMKADFPAIKMIILTMDRDTLMVHPDGQETIHKGCGKAEFAKRITGIVLPDSPIK